jgi:RHS repeat-associated protein
MFRRYRFLTSQIAFALILALLFGTFPASAFHFPWDQGHDTFSPNPGDDDTDPGDDDCNNTGSPFEIASGNFLQQIPVLYVPSFGPSLEIVLSYNSRDMRNGAFGHGWSLSYDQRLVETTDGVSVTAICHQGSGKRERFTRLSTGTYASPGDLSTRLIRSSDSTFTLRDKDGTQRRFDVAGRLIAIADPHGNTMTFTYDGTGFMTAITDASGRSVTFSKGADGRVATMTDPAGRTYRFGYDTNGNLTSYTDAAAGVTSYRYDVKHNLTEITDARGNLDMKVTYDSLGRVTSYTEGANTWSITYTPAQKRTTKRNSNNETWTFTYNDNGNVTSILDPLSRTESFGYSESFLPLRHTDKRGGSRLFAHDGSGNTTSMTDPLSQVAELRYDATFNKVSSITSPLRAISSFEYSSTGSLLRFVDPQGNATRMSYNSRGSLTGITDALGHATTFTYDEHGNPTQSVDALGGTWTYGYDLVGNMTSAVDPLGNRTQLDYDDRDRLVRLTDARNGVTTFEYDPVGNLVSFTDPNGNTTTFEYDIHDRLVRAVQPGNRIHSYSYDSRNNLSSKVNPKGQSTTYLYDALHRVTRKTLPDNVIQYTYDADGNVLSVTDNDSSLVFTYDGLDHVLRAETRAGVAQPATVLTASYDADGNRTSLASSLGGAWSFERDSIGRLQRVQNPQGDNVSFSYDAVSRVTGLNASNGTATSLTYDAAGQITEVKTSRSGSTLAQLSSQYDRNGKRTVENEGAGTHTYSYDSLLRLVGSSHPGGGSETFGYDPSGNRTSSHLSASHRYDEANRLLENDQFLYTWDANGNLITKSSKADSSQTRYGYDAEDRLVRVDRPDGSVITYRYDGLGRRIEKNVNGSISRFVYDGEDILLELDGANQVVASYTHGDGEDEVLSVRRGGQSFFLHPDAMGSVRHVTDSSGTVVASRSYEAWGRPLVATGALPSGHAFTGRELDQETGLYYYRARYYDPETGRFLQEDPRGISSGDTNFYTYVYGDPVNLVDPDGEIPAILVGIVVGAGLDLAFQLIQNGGRFDCVDWVQVGISGALGAVGGQSLKWFKLGKEFKWGKNFRAAPFGNRTGHPLGRWPHYHRRGVDPTGATKPGQGIGRHRPWETKSTDTSFWDRL